MQNFEKRMGKCKPGLGLVHGLFPCRIIVVWCLSHHLFECLMACTPWICSQISLPWVSGEVKGYMHFISAMQLVVQA